jgi:O-antigen/teichoic acid export membrane protein
VNELKHTSLKENFYWTLVSNIVLGLSQWGIIIAFAKLGSPEIVGQYVLALTIATPVFTFASLSLRTVQVTDVQNHYSFSNYFFLRLATTILALIVASIFTTVSHYDFTSKAVIFSVSLLKSVEAISDIFQGQFHQSERMDIISKSNILKQVFSLCISVFVFSATRNILISVGLMILIHAFIISIYELPHLKSSINLKNSINSELDWKRYSLKSILQSKPIFFKLIKLSSVALPAGLLMTTLSLAASVPRYFLEKYDSQIELGILGALIYLPTAGAILVNALGQSSLPRMAGYYHLRDKRSFQSIVIKTTCIGLAIGALGLLFSFFFGGNFLYVVYSPQYASRSGILNLLMLWGAIVYVSSFLGYAIAAAGYFKPCFIVSLGSLVMTVLSSLLCLPHYTIFSAAVSLLSGAFFQMLGYCCIYYHISQNHFLPAKN